MNVLFCCYDNFCVKKMIIMWLLMIGYLFDVIMMVLIEECGSFE